MLHAIFDIGELLVRQVMVPRTEIVAVEADTRLKEVEEIAIQSLYTKFPVYEDNLDQIVGVLHIKEVLRMMRDPNKDNCTARELAREPFFVPEAIPVNELLRQLRARRQHIAIVLDEYGGTAGLVTLEDVMEEIVGEVSDTFDIDEPEIQTLPDGTALIDGFTLIEEVNEELELTLNDPHYDTIAGYILGRLGRIARQGDVIESQGVRLRVVAMDGLRIARVALSRVLKTE
jgi:CBS domain containing-hemolysin-like protein